MLSVRTTGKVLAFLIAPLLVFTSWTSLRAETPVKVAVLPFTMNAPSNMSYLGDGIRDMLTSRLAWKDKVQVVDRASTDLALKGSKSPLAESDALRIGQSLKADYVLFGSVTAVGQAVSIDASMLPVLGKGEPISLYAQTNSLDEVVPRINRFAQDVNQKLFGRAVERAEAAPQGEEQLFSTRNPELLVPDAMDSSQRTSHLNPNFLEITPDGTITNAGIWKSQTFLDGIVSMDMGDVDGDKRPEVVTVSFRKVTVYKREANALRTIAVYDATKMDRFTYVSLADVNRDGKDEIFVTNMRKFNNPSGNSTDSVSYGQHEEKLPSSFALAFTNGKLQPLGKPVPYFLNAVAFPNRGKVVLGQKPGTDATFDDQAFEMVLKGNQLTASIPVSLPRRCNVFNFVRADVNGDKSDEYVVIDDDNELLIMDSAGSPLSKSSKHFSATTNYILGKVHDLRYNHVDYYYLPSSIAVYDLNKDGILEVILNRSSDYNNFMPEGLKYYERGEVVSLSYDQMGFVENWKTREISGMVTSVRIGDLNQDGVPELVVALVMSKDFTKLWESKSTIYSYDLNVAAKTAQAQKQ
jgi:TolB-like protein